MTIPAFATEEAEAGFWDTHSPLDFAENPETERLIAFKECSMPKTKSLTIRIGDGMYNKLQDLAKLQGINVSTLVRFALVTFIKGG